MEITETEGLPEEVNYESLLDQLIENARTDFYTFVRLMAPEVLPGDFKNGRHIKIICKKLQEVLESVELSSIDPDNYKPKRVQVFLPPGSMKSKLASNLFPAWCMGRHSNWCFLAIGSDQQFAIDNFGRPTKDLVSSERYKAIFPRTALRKDVQAAGAWNTTNKGVFIAKGAGQNIAGRRAHISICDDVITEQTLDSGREKVNNWYLDGLRTRLLPEGAELIINTRWHLNDLSGFMEGLDKKTNRPWEIITFPALLDEEASDLLREAGDPPELFAPGTSYWPEMWPTDLLLEKKETMRPPKWNALYMQKPVQEEGNIIKRSDFQVWGEVSGKNPEKPPQCKYLILSVDTAFSEKERADYSAYTLWGIFKEAFETTEGDQISRDGMILLSSDKGRWDFNELAKRIQDISEKRRVDFVIIEEKTLGISLIRELGNRGVPVLPYKPENDKTFRLQACTPFFQAGRIWIPDKEYAWNVVDEVVTFPAAPHDDLADTVSQAVLWMRDNFELIHNDYNYSLEDQREEWLKSEKMGTYWSSLID